MDESLYNKRVDCPVCKRNIEVTRVRSKACKVSSRDSDFCIYYESVNPFFYDVWVCEFCGFAAHYERFENITPLECKMIKENISPYWNSRKFTGERDVNKALETLKLALYNLQKSRGKASEFTKICIRIAWMYRLSNDPREMEFLGYALNYYYEIFENENLPVGKLDKATCMYMIGELNRRTGKLSEAKRWFTQVISSKEESGNKALVEMAREQYMILKEEKTLKNGA